MPGSAVDVPDAIVIIEEFVDADTMSAIVDYADGQIGLINKVGVVEPDGRLGATRNDGFSSDRIYATGIHDLATEICNKIFGEVIPDNYGHEVEWYEYPHIIRYRIGGNYGAHADSENWDDEKSAWVRGVNRDYSAILYINDQFEGGPLYFPQHDFRVFPKPGLLVCFPSDGRYVHQAEPVTRGIRYAFVTWAAAQGTPRASNQQPDEFELVYMKDQ